MAILELICDQSNVKTDLLWENPSPTASFASQVVSVSKDGYDGFLILAKDGSCILYNMNGASSAMIGVFSFGWGNGSAYNLSIRNANITTKGISFGTCKIIDGGPLNTATFNQNCVPQKIYGFTIKGGA